MWQQINSKEISQLLLILKHTGTMKLLKKKNNKKTLQVMNSQLRVVTKQKGLLWSAVALTIRDTQQLSSQYLKQPHSQVPNIPRNSYSAAGISLWGGFSCKQQALT